MGFGERLQREREMRGITLEEIANATKIGARSLRALEQEDFDKLPGGIFNKGFVRSYARYLGIDEEQAVADYLIASGQPQEDELGEGEPLKKLGSSWKPSPPPASGEPSRVPWRALTLLVLLGVLVILAVHYGGPVLQSSRRWLAGHHVPGISAEPPSSPVLPAAPMAGTTPQDAAQASPSPVADASSSPTLPAETASPAAPNNVPSAAGNSGPEDAPGNSTQTPARADNNAAAEPGQSDSGHEFVLVIRAREDSWVKVTADGKAVLSGVLTARREKTVHARQRITVIAGNAGGIDLSFNGKPQPPLGTDNQVRTVTFTRQGMQD